MCNMVVMLDLQVFFLLLLYECSNIASLRTIKFSEHFDQNQTTLTFQAQKNKC